MKKWVNVPWDEIQPGDEICLKRIVPDGRFIVDHIGDRCCKEVGIHRVHSRSFGRLRTDFHWQRYEETELPDDWYLVEYVSERCCSKSEIVRYKIGNMMYDHPVASKPISHIKNYKILKRARFEDLEE